MIKIVNSPTTVTLYVHTKIMRTNIHNMNIHSYTIQISGPIGLYSNTWANGIKYCGLYTGRQLKTY